MRYFYFLTLIISGVFVYCDIIFFKSKFSIESKQNKNSNKMKEFLEIETIKDRNNETSYDFLLNLKSNSNLILFILIAFIIFLVPVLNIVVYGLLLIFIFEDKISSFFGV